MRWKMKCVVYCCLYTAVVFFVSVLSYYLSSVPEYDLDIVNASAHACVKDIKHCGCCGACSDSQDLKVYNTSSLTEDARSCAVDRLFEDTRPCFEGLGMTNDCANCWAENVKCTKENCWFPCLMETILGIKSDTSLSRCFACDEKHCGKEFARCSGLTRRRANIETDIHRDSRELCSMDFSVNGTQC